LYLQIEKYDTTEIQKNRNKSENWLKCKDSIFFPKPLFRFPLTSSMISLSPPNELSFKRPFTTGVVTQSLIVGNDSAHPIAFKVKTTAPKQYCVRPNSGLFYHPSTPSIAIYFYLFAKRSIANIYSRSSQPRRKVYSPSPAPNNAERSPTRLQMQRPVPQSFFLPRQVPRPIHKDPNRAYLPSARTRRIMVTR
jgi:hypothetical protein